MTLHSNEVEKNPSAVAVAYIETQGPQNHLADTRSVDPCHYKILFSGDTFNVFRCNSCGCNSQIECKSCNHSSVLQTLLLTIDR